MTARVRDLPVRVEHENSESISSISSSVGLFCAIIPRFTNDQGILKSFYRSAESGKMGVGENMDVDRSRERMEGSSGRESEMKFEEDGALVKMAAGSSRINRWLEEIPSDAWPGLVVIGCVACSVLTTALLGGYDVSVNLGPLRFTASKGAAPVVV